MTLNSFSCSKKRRHLLAVAERPSTVPAARRRVPAGLVRVRRRDRHPAGNPDPDQAQLERLSRYGARSSAPPPENRYDCPGRHCHQLRRGIHRPRRLAAWLCRHRGGGCLHLTGRRVAPDGHHRPPAPGLPRPCEQRDHGSDLNSRPPKGPGSKGKCPENRVEFLQVPLSQGDGKAIQTPCLTS